MRRRIAVLGVTDAALDALPSLASHPDVELACVYDADAMSVRRRLALYEPHAAALLQKLLTDDPGALDGLELVSGDRALELVGGARPAAASTEPDSRTELAQALAEIADAAELVATPEALWARLLEAAIAATGASGGSLLRADESGEVLRVAAAVGLERELWGKVAIRLGEGLAGRAFAERRPVVVAGPASAAHFEIARERRDVAASACIPFGHDGGVLGVLCVHHGTRADLFGADDLEPLEAIGAALGRIAARADAGDRAQRDAALRAIEAEIRAVLGEPRPLAPRLAALCAIAARCAGAGVATLWWNEEPGAAEPSLCLVATSLAGGGLGAAAQLAPGAGLDGRAARDRLPVFLARDGAPAFAALPLVDRAMLLGVLSIQAGGGTVADERTLASFACCAAEALGRDRAAAETRERLIRAAALGEATQRLLALCEIDPVAEELATSAALVLEAEHAVVRVLDPAQRSFRVRARTGGADPLAEDVLALDRRAAREAVRVRAPVDAQPLGDEDRALLVVPIVAAERVIGTLGLYGRRAPAPVGFDAADRDAALHLVAAAARALGDALRPAAPFAAERVLAADGFARRLDAEIARAAVTQGAAPFLLVTCRVENADAIGTAATARALERLCAAWVAELRPFDALAQTAPGTLTALLPEPGGAPALRVARLARVLREAFPHDGDEPALALGFGHALHPVGAGTRAELLARAAEIRIRML